MKRDDARQQAQAMKHTAQPPPSPPAGANRMTELEQQVADLTKQLKQLTETAARAQADLQNAKIRLEKDGADVRKFAAELTLLKLLSTIDNFQRAFKHLPDDIKEHQWVKGVAAIEQEFMKQLSDLGLKRFESLGRHIDASRHEVLMEGPGEKGKVTEVFEEGYELHGKVLRPAKVKVGVGQKEQQTISSP